MLRAEWECRTKAERGPDVGPPPMPSKLREWPNFWEKVNQEIQCFHGQMVLTVKVASNGVKFYKKQCPTCGEAGPSLPHAQLSYAAREAAIPKDEEIAARWRDRKLERFRELQAEFQASQGQQKASDDDEWWRWYSAYLQTPAWRNRRSAVLRRDGGLCQGCLLASATQVHHKTYEHVGSEFLFELETICDECHERLHPGRPG